MSKNCGHRTLTAREISDANRERVEDRQKKDLGLRRLRIEHARAAYELENRRKFDILRSLSLYANTGIAGFVLLWFTIHNVDEEYFSLSIYDASWTLTCIIAFSWSFSCFLASVFTMFKTAGDYKYRWLPGGSVIQEYISDMDGYLSRMESKNVANSIAEREFCIFIEKAYWDCYETNQANNEMRSLYRDLIRRFLLGGYVLGGLGMISFLALRWRMPSDLISRIAETILELKDTFGI